MADRKRESETEEKAGTSKDTAKKAGAKEAPKKTGAKKTEAKTESKKTEAKTAATKSGSKRGAAKPAPKGRAKAKGADAAAAESKGPGAKSSEKTRAKAEKGSGKAGASRRTRRAGGGAAAAPERPVVNARARFVRVAPRKARLVADQVRGLPLDQALTLLRFSPRTATRDIEKLSGSAAANAENNHDLVADDLRIAEINVDEGPTLRRFQPRALGRATRINKRTCHIRVALTPED